MELFFSSSYRLGRKNIALNISNVLQNLVNWNNSIINILDPELHTSIYANWIVVAQQFLSLNDGGKKKYREDLRFVDSFTATILPTNQLACWLITFGLLDGIVFHS